MTSRSANGSTAVTAPSNLTHYPALDGFRAIAFLGVFFVHYYSVPWGFAGVNFFFVLSGFLITGILVDSEDRPGRARQFYIRRALRIFPLYYGVMLLVVLLWPLFHWRWSVPWLAWPLYVGNFLRFRSGASHDMAGEELIFGGLRSLNHPGVFLRFGHFWSLCVEEQFYLIWPWVVFWVRSRKVLMGICLGAVVLGPLARVLASIYAPGWMVGHELTYVVGVPFQMDALLLGGLLALLWRGAHRARLQQLATVFLGVSTVLLLLYCAYERHLHPAGPRTAFTYPKARITWDLTLINIVGAALMICALRPGSLTYQMLNVRPLRYLGRISYGLYVFHDIPHTIYIRFAQELNKRGYLRPAHNDVAILVFGFLATLALASLSYRYFERSFLALKDRWAPSRRFESEILVPAS